MMFPMLMFRFILIILILMSLIMLQKMRSIRKNDIILYRFCQLRRDIMGILRDRNFNNEKDSYFALRNALEWLNLLIHEYNHCKIHIFNVRRFVKILKALRETTDKVEKIPLPNDPTVRRIYNGLRYSMWMAFLAYTPLIKSEITLMLIIKSLEFMVKIGIKQVKTLFDYLVWVEEEKKTIAACHDIGDLNGFSRA